MEAAKPKRRDPVIFWTVVVTAVLVALALALWLWHAILAERVNKQIQAMRAKGYPVTLAGLNDWYPDVPEVDNAAYVYLSAFDNFADGAKLEADSGIDLPVVGTGELPPRGEPLPPDMRDLIAAYLKMNAESLRLLHAGMAKTRCKYPVDFRAGMSMRLPHLARIRQGARLLQLEGILNADDDMPKAAAESVRASIHLGNSLAQEPLLISNLVRIAVLSLARKNAEYVLNRVALSDQDLATLSKEFAACETTQPMQRAMVCETVEMLDVFEHTENLASYSGSGDVGLSIMLSVSSFTGVLKVEESKAIGLMRKQIEVADLPVERWMDAMANTSLEKNVMAMPRTYIISRMLLPALDRAYTEELRNFARLRTAGTAFAVERYRLKCDKLPETLNALVPEFVDAVPLDPFDGQPLRYKKTDKGYVVYSVDMNLVDDGGIEEPGIGHAYDERDITFTVERPQE